MTAQTSTEYATREEWLIAAVAALTPLFEAIDQTVPAVRVSVGWPGGNGRKNAVIGQCWATAASADNVAQLFISPVLDDAVRVLDVLAHEMIHAIDDCQSGHKGNFAKIAKALGLTGKMTATVAGDELKERLEAIAFDLGLYPHAALANPGAGADGPKKQTTRMMKAECPEGSGYKVRLTRQWIAEYGAPICPHCGEQMEAE
jgi:hypothetical protein